MSIVFDEDWDGYAVGTPIPLYPSKLGGLWSIANSATGVVSNADSYSSPNSIQWQTNGGLRWEDTSNLYVSGTFKIIFKSSTSRGTWFPVFFDLMDAEIPATMAFPQPVRLFRLRFENDSTISLYVGHTEEFVCNSGSAHSGTTPLGAISTTVWSAEVDTWYICYVNVTVSTDPFGFLKVSCAVHMNDLPVLAKEFISVNSDFSHYPHGSTISIPFNFLNLFTTLDSFSFLDNFVFDTNAAIQPGSGATSSARVSQGTIEPYVLSPAADRYARVSTANIELETLPDNYARVTQAVIELWTEFGSVPSGSGGWKIYEA